MDNGQPIGLAFQQFFWILDIPRFFLQMTVELGQAGCIFSSKVLIELSLCQISQLNFLLLQ